MISNCGHDENGRYSGGKAGDQTGTEWQVIPWYNRPWNCVIRHPDAAVRKMLADMAVKAAKNDNIGYDQYERDSFGVALKASGDDPSKITVKCETDCSKGVIDITKAVGRRTGRTELQNVNATYTGNMRAGFKSAGFTILTDSKYLTSDKYLLAGDILLNDGAHTAINVTDGSASGTAQTTASVTAADLPVATTEKQIYTRLYATIKNHFGVSGLMGNLYAESALSPINLQNNYEKSLGMTDDTYTRFVDGGVYNNFVYDCAGYGLAQWTYWSRKENLLKYSRSKKVSVGDLNMQIDFLLEEMKLYYSAVLTALKNAKSVKEASDLVLTQYEKPADQGESMKNKRASYGLCYYNRYAGTGATSTAKPAQTASTATIKYSAAVKAWQKAMNKGFDIAGTSRALEEDGYFGTASTAFAQSHPLYMGISGRATAVKWLQGVLKITKDGSFGCDTRKAVLAFQKKKGIAQDGNVGLETTKKLLNL